jgi:hypothetical protein
MNPRRVLAATLYLAGTALFWVVVGYALGFRL